jgi:hypothetical protein
MFLHNGNKFPSVPLAHAANIEESYDNIKQLFTIYYFKSLSDALLTAPPHIFSLMFYDLIG